MATAAKIDDLLQCPVCLEIFYDPRVLDCQHTFCANCLKVHLAASSRMLRVSNAIDCRYLWSYFDLRSASDCCISGPICRRRTNLLNNSVDNLPSNFIVRDIIERQYGTAVPTRPDGYDQQIQNRLKKLNQTQEDKNDDGDDNSTNYSDYIKPAAAALIGVLGGLLLAKGVKKLSDYEKKQDRR